MIEKYLKDLGLKEPHQIKALVKLITPLLQGTAVGDAKSLLNNQYKIAVVANMSAGKSTFINAMFADNVLPTYTEATTDCPVYIYSDDNPNNDKAIIEFSDSKTTVELSRDEVKKELKFYAKKDSKELDSKYKNVYRIHLYWDFVALQNKKNSHFNFVFIDTPGPNNTDEFGGKHYKTTKDIILTEADMVIYLLDYGQLDANLEIAKESIWDFVKQRKDKDKNFEAFFVINKIDMALDDNSRLSKVKDANSEEEFYKNLNKFWLYHENKAIEKIKKTAKICGFSNPKVFTASSEYQKLIRMKDILWNDKSKLNNLKALFQAIFKEDWEKQLTSYLEVSWIEENTRMHLETIEEKVLKKIYDGLESLLNNYPYINVNTQKKIRKFKRKHYSKQNNKWIIKYHSINYR